MAGLSALLEQLRALTSQPFGVNFILRDNQPIDRECFEMAAASARVVDLFLWTPPDPDPGLFDLIHPSRTASCVRASRRPRRLRARCAPSGLGITAAFRRERTIEPRLALEGSCLTPRFVHGDCHAHQFFVEMSGAEPRVAGVVDMEVASAGDPIEDLLKFSLEVRARSVGRCLDGRVAQG